jgi:hypothetical protein
MTSPQPVTQQENRNVNGLAQCARYIVDDRMAEMRRLRQKHADYLASLPTDPAECIKQALKVLTHNFEPYPERFMEALHLSYAIGPMVKDMDPEPVEPEGSREALINIAERITDCLRETAAQLEHAVKILGNPERATSRRGDFQA